MTDELREIFRAYANGNEDLGMLLIHLTRIEGDVPLSRLSALLDRFYAEQE